MSNPKLKVGMYWAASCGGCDVALLDIHEKILDVVAVADLVFWPCAMDFKVHHVEAMPDGHMDLVFITGAVRNSENEHMVKLLRRKAKLVCAFGSCAHMGGIPGLANFWDRESIMRTVYLESPSTENPKGTLPVERFKAPEGELTLPHLYDTVKTLGQTIEVDYFLPGCPPNPDQIATVIGLIATGRAPARGSVVGASERAMCEECTRKKTELGGPRRIDSAGGDSRQGGPGLKFKSFKRRHLTHPDPEVCFMEQGIVCVGAATRAGCGWRCIGSNMPCRGCYGPLPNVQDQGAKMLSAIAACIDADTPEDVDRILDTMPDPAGTFYRFALPASMLRRRQRGTETTAG